MFERTFKNINDILHKDSGYMSAFVELGKPKQARWVFVDFKCLYSN